MDTFDIVALNKTREASDLLARHSRFRAHDPEQIALGLRSVYKNLRLEEKEDFLRSLADIHPDYDLFQDIFSGEPNYVYENGYAQASGCGCGGKVHANGQSVVSHYMASGEATNITAGTFDRLNKLEQEQNTNKLLNQKLFNAFILIAVVVFAYKTFK
jgi:hypothetical protein